MHYVKQFDINGVATKQVACIELHGKPNAATEGCVGVLGIDLDSPTRDVYKCSAVNGSIYTWELLSSGLSIMVASVSAGEALTARFSYANMKIPTTYMVKIGDLIIDTDARIYQINALYSEYCMASHCVTIPRGKDGADGTVSFDELTDAQKASLKGEPGDDGRGIESVTTSYAVSDSLSTRPERGNKWSKDIPTVPDGQYLWMCFTIHFTNDMNDEYFICSKYGAKGKDGENGKNAYQYAKEGGYAGTEAEFATKFAFIMGYPIYGYLDENKNIIISGMLLDGTYPLKYKNEDGTYSDVGMVVVGGAIVTDIPITWNEGYTCGYTVGQNYALTENSGYCTSDVIEVEAGVTYTLKVNGRNATSVRFVGADNNGIVTETIENPVIVGDNTYTFTPSANTTQIRIRSYASVSTWGWTLTK